VDATAKKYSPWSMRVGERSTKRSSRMPVQFMTTMKRNGAKSIPPKNRRGMTRGVEKRVEDVGNEHNYVCFFLIIKATGA
jgi:hypothetical protein